MEASTPKEKYNPTRETIHHSFEEMSEDAPTVFGYTLLEIRVLIAREEHRRGLKYELVDRSRCFLCGCSRNQDGCCSFIGCKDPLFDNRVECRAARSQALDNLWAAVKADWKLGYSAAFTEACENLRKLEAGQ